MPSFTPEEERLYSFILIGSVALIGGICYGLAVLIGPYFDRIDQRHAEQFYADCEAGRTYHMSRNRAVACSAYLLAKDSRDDD